MAVPKRKAAVQAVQPSDEVSDEYSSGDELVEGSSEEFGDDDVEFSDGSDELADDAPEDADAHGKASSEGHLHQLSAADEDVLMTAQTTSDATVLQLEINELLAETRVDYSREKATDEAVAKLKKLLTSIPEHQVSGQGASGFIQQLGLPLETADFTFHPPSRVAVVGSYLIRAVARPTTCVDVAVEIPEACLFKKAHLNYRYHARRSVYLSTIASHLLSHSQFKSCELAALQDDPTRPVLLITPPGSSNSGVGFKIRVIPVPPADLFPAARLAPTRNSVRSVAKPAADGQALAGAGAAGGEGDADQCQVLPTPYYNAAVTQEMVALTHSTYLDAAFKASPRMAEGLLLLKVWARQHGLSTQTDGPSGHMLAMLMAHLAQQGKLAAAMTSLQMFRAALHSFTETTTTTALSKGIAMAPWIGSMGERSLPGSGQPGVRVFKKHHDVVFVDFTGWCNLAANMTKSCLGQVQAAAKKTLALLDNPSDPDEAFTATFLSPSSPASSFDYHWRVTLPEPEEACSICKDRVMWREQEQQVEALIKQALGDRAKLVRCVRRRVGSWQKSDLTKGLLPLAHQSILVTARLDPALATRLVDIGPAADDAKASAKFQSFWGSKSELRRFQDGKISEAVVWDCPPAERHTISDRIVQYVFERHMPGSSVISTSGRLDFSLTQKGIDPSSGVVAGRLLESALDKLGKQLRTLEDVALKVVGVQPLSSHARQTCVFFPHPHPLAGGAGDVGEGRLARCLEPVEVLVQVENSGKWPSDVVAFQKMKAALGLQLAGALEKGSGHKAVASEEHIDVLAEGFAFRLTLYSGRDEVMLSKALQTSHRVPGQLSAEESPLLRSWHHGLVSSVAGANPTFAPSARLAKRWVACHLMSNHLCEEAVELLMVAAFTAPCILPQPASRVTGLLRFLQLLARHPWSTRPLVVDPDKQLSMGQRRDIQRRFDERRRAGQLLPPLYLCTPRDLESSHWTHDRPGLEVMQHLVVLAAKAAKSLQMLLEAGQGSGPAKAELVAEDTSAWHALFHTSLTEYDALVVLRKEALPQADRALVGAQKLPHRRSQPHCLTVPLEEEGAEPPAKRARAFLRAFPDQVVESRGPDQLRAELLVGFDPLAPLLHNLEDRFGHLATFCADGLGGNLLGVKWQATAFLPAPAKVATSHTALPCPTSGLGMKSSDSRQLLCVPNIVNILSEIRQLGEGIVEDVVLPSGGYGRLV